MKKSFTYLLIFLACAFLTWHFLARKRNIDRNRNINGSGALRGLQLMTHARAYPAANIPETGMAQAFQLMRAKAKNDMVQAWQEELEPWRSIGPNNISGRTLAVAVNPQNNNTIYAGSASGGLWRSYSAGIGANAWHRIMTGFPVLAVSSIAIAPNDSNTIYIGTGEVYGHPNTQPGIMDERTARGMYGIGILKTTDNGQTWHKKLDWSFNQQRGVQMIQINPLRPESVWAATTEGTFKSMNAGETWQNIHAISMATDIAINPQDTSIVFVAYGGMGSEGKGIYRTKNSGESWVRLDVPDTDIFLGKIRLGMSASSPNIIYASIGRESGDLTNPLQEGSLLAKTIDGGDTWSDLGNVINADFQGWYSHDIAVHPTNPDTVWGAGISDPKISVDGGNEWFNAEDVGFVTHPETAQLGLEPFWVDYHHILFDPTDPNIIYLANDGGIFRIDVKQTTIRNINRGYQTAQFYNGVACSDIDSLFMIAGMQDRGTAAYEGNPNWRRFFNQDGSWSAINQADNDVIFWSLQWLSIAKSTNRGINAFNFENVTFVSPPRPGGFNHANFIAPYVLSPADNLTLYAGRHLVYRSENGDDKWTDTNNGQAMDGNFFVAMAASHQDVDVLYAATSPNIAPGNVFTTRDGGENWKNITKNLPNRFYTDLAVDPSDDRTVIVTLGGFGSSHVFRSDDGGDSWQDIGTGLPDIPMWSVVIDPDFPEQIFVGNDLSIFFSPDRGQTWHEHHEGLPEAIVAMDLLISRSNRMLRVATHGSGFYESKLPTPPIINVSDLVPILPKTIALEQNYPNPFNMDTRITYFLDRSQKVNVIIFNVNGQEIQRLVDKYQESGWHEITWDGTNNRGEVIATGIYILHLRSEAASYSRKIILSK